VIKMKQNKKIKYILVCLFVFFSMIQPNFHISNSITNESEDDIVILDESKINVLDSKHFSIGDINGDGIKELITLKSYTTEIDTICKIQIYKKNAENWDLYVDPIQLDLPGLVQKVGMGNFDQDQEEEIVIANRITANSTQIYILNYNSLLNEITYEPVLKIDAYISDLYVVQTKNKPYGTIFVLYSLADRDPHFFETNILLIDREKNGAFASNIIYTEQDVYWNLISTGNFLSSVSDDIQILIHRYEETSSVLKQSIVSVLSLSGKTLSESKIVGERIKSRDIISQNVDKDGYDELVILESNYGGNEIGYNNRLTYYKINTKEATEIQIYQISSKEYLSQMSIGTFDEEKEQLLILDPSAGILPYLRAIDDEAKLYYDVYGYWDLNLEFSAFENLYDLNFGIDAFSVGDYFYTSVIKSGYSSDSEGLLADLVDKTKNVRYTYGAEEVIGIIENYHSDFWVGGRAY